MWGGKHRFSSPDGNAFADTELRRGIVSGLKAPSTSPEGRGVVLRKAPGSAEEEPGARAGRPKERAALGPSGYVASCLCAPGHLGRVFARGDLSCGLLGWKVSGPRESTHLPRLRGDKMNQPGPPPPARAPALGPHGSVLPGCVRGECF